MSDPLEKLLITFPVAGIRQRAWAILCASAGDWVCSGVEFNKDAALEEMKVQREKLPALEFNVVPCSILVEGSKPISILGKNGFADGDRVRLTAHGRRQVRQRHPNVLGTVVARGRKSEFVTVRWDGQSPRTSQIYAVRFIEKAKP